MISFFASHINMFKTSLSCNTCFKCLLWEEILFSLLGMQFFKCLQLLIQTHSIKKKKSYLPALGENLLGKHGLWCVKCRCWGEEAPKASLIQHRWGGETKRSVSPKMKASQKTWCLSVSGTCLSTTERLMWSGSFPARSQPCYLIMNTASKEVSTVATLDTHLVSLSSKHSSSLPREAWSPICSDPLLLAFSNSQAL